MLATRTASPSGVGLSCGWGERGWPITGQARRSDMPRALRISLTNSRRRERHTVFPEGPSKISLSNIKSDTARRSQVFSA